MSIKETIRALEEHLARSSSENSEQDVSELIADKFIEYGSSGRVYNKTQVLEGILGREPVKIDFPNFKVKSLAPDILLTTFQAVLYESDERKIYSLRSSIWKLTEGKWQIIFHQGTPMKTGT